MGSFSPFMRTWRSVEIDKSNNALGKLLPSSLQQVMGSGQRNLSLTATNPSMNYGKGSSYDIIINSVFRRLEVIQSNEKCQKQWPEGIMDINWATGLMSRVFTNGLRDRGSIPGRVILKTQKMVLDAALINTQHCKVRIKVKWSNPGNIDAPSTTPRCSSYWKGSLRVTLD